MQVKVANISADHTRTCQSNLCIHIGAVHINQSAVCMNDTAYLFNAFFKHTMRAGVSNHQSRKVCTVLFRFQFKIIHINMSIFGTLHNHNLHTRHDGAGRICAMSRDRDQNNIAMTFFSIGMISPDGKQTGIFTLRTAIRLKGTGSETGNAAEVLLQFTDHV